MPSGPQCTVCGAVYPARLAKSLAESLGKLQEIIQEPLKGAYQRSAREEPEYYNSILKENPVGVAFFGIEDGELRLFSKIFKPDDSNGMKIEIVDQNFAGNHVKEISYICMGCSGALQAATIDATFNRGMLPDPENDKEGYVKYIICFPTANAKWSRCAQVRARQPMRYFIRWAP